MLYICSCIVILNGTASDSDRRFIADEYLNKAWLHPLNDVVEVHADEFALFRQVRQFLCVQVLFPVTELAAVYQFRLYCTLVVLLGDVDTVLDAHHDLLDFVVVERVQRNWLLFRLRLL